MAPRKSTALAIATGSAAILAIGYQGCGGKDDTGGGGGGGGGGDDDHKKCSQYTKESDCKGHGHCEWEPQCVAHDLMSTDNPNNFCQWVGATDTDTNGMVCLAIDGKAVGHKDNKCSKDGKPIIVQNGSNCDKSCYAEMHITCTYQQFSCEKKNDKCLPTPNGHVSSNFNIADTLCAQGSKHKCVDVEPAGTTVTDSDSDGKSGSSTKLY